MALANFETYVHGRSRLHTWTPRLKLVSLGLLMFAFAAVRHLALVPPMLCLTAVLYLLSELPFPFLLKRLSYPGLFILVVVLVLPFSTGETVLWQWGALALRQEGIETMLLILGRFLSILTLGFILLGTTPFVTLLRALRSLGLPTLIADMTLLTYRYLFETAEMLSTMQRSMRLRGFGQQRRRFRLQRQDLQRLAGLLGTLLVRSYERSERVYKAMQLRGYGQLKRPVESPSIDSSSALLTGFSMVAALSFVIVEFSLPAAGL